MSKIPQPSRGNFVERSGWMHPARWNAVQDKYWTVEGKEGAALRAQYYAPFFQRFGRDVVIEAGCRFSHPFRIILDDGVRINREMVIEGSSSVYIGPNARVGNRCFVHSANHDVAPDNPQAFFERGYVYKPVWIGDNVLISANVSIMPGAHIDNGCFVAASALVLGKNYPQNSSLGGVPAKSLIIKKSARSDEKLVCAPAIALITG